MTMEIRQGLPTIMDIVESKRVLLSVTCEEYWALMAALSKALENDPNNVNKEDWYRLYEEMKDNSAKAV